MDRRTSLGLNAGSAGRLRRSRVGLKDQDEIARVGDESSYDWIADIRDGTDYKLLKRIPRVDVVFLTPPERGGCLRLDFIEWNSFDGPGDVLHIPVARPNPEWHVLGPARYSVSLWMGPLPRSRTPGALIQFEVPTSVSVYTHDDRIQQVVLLTEGSAD